jgi:hypothetical protein
LLRCRSSIMICLYARWQMLDCFIFLRILSTKTRCFEFLIGIHYIVYNVKNDTLYTMLKIERRIQHKKLTSRYYPFLATPKLVVAACY